MSIEEYLDEMLTEMGMTATLLDGYSDAIVGYTTNGGESVSVIYSYDKCIDVLRKRDGMAEGEAVEFFEFNTMGFMPKIEGSGAPIVMETLLWG